MNIKQFKRHWLNSKVEPELFYMPVKKDMEREPMILEVEITEVGVQTSFFSSVLGLGMVQYDNTSIQEISNKQYSALSNSSVYYNLHIAGDKGQKVSPITHPDWFNDAPFVTYDIDETGNINTQVFTKLTPVQFTSATPYLKIDWGDGVVEKTDFETTETNFILRNKGRDYTLTGGTIKVNANWTSHTYQQAGNYFIKIYGEFPHLSFSNKVKGVVQWGNIGLRSLHYSFYNVSDFYIPKTFTGMDYVVSMADAFGGCQWLTSDKLAPDCMKAFPYLTCLYGTFSGTKIDVVYDNMFSYNNFLCTAQFAFNNCPLQYIGNYSFANLPYLWNIFQVFYNYRNSSNGDYSTYIGNSIFENDISLSYIENALMSDRIVQIGDYTFKNCKRLQAATENLGLDYSATLISVGKGMFEGCESLVTVYGLFGESYNLKTIGEDMFKGCTKLQNCAYLFYDCPLLEKVPDRLFYDIEYNEEYNGWSFYHTFYSEGRYANYQTVDEIPYREIGTEIFNPEFLSRLKAGQVDFYACFDYSPYVNGYHTRWKGDAPDLWNYISEDGYTGGGKIFGFERYTVPPEADYTYNCTNTFNNYNEIPKTQPWLYVHPTQV